MFSRQSVMVDTDSTIDDWSIIAHSYFKFSQVSFLLNILGHPTFTEIECFTQKR